LIRSEGLRLLDAFATRAGVRYGKTRNFDWGPNRRNNVSRLSPYIRHRLVLEQEVLEATLQHHMPEDASKFIQEVFWRAYFKGWLEHRPTVWADYCSGVRKLMDSLGKDSALGERFSDAVNGRTGIECFDDWANELVETGYLHNHARMWFASIWIYTLELPWELGADFFYRHLLDGDPASNTCSWRWVCGLHTKGKTYLARASNIARYTDNRFNPEGQLATRALPLRETREHLLRDLPPPGKLSGNGPLALLVTEEDCCPESLTGPGRLSEIVGITLTSRRSPLPVAQPVIDFARAAVSDALDRASDAFECPATCIDPGNDMENVIQWAKDRGVKEIATAYAAVGPVADVLSEIEVRLAEHDVRLIQLRRSYDEACWPHATRGYFKLRQHIPGILRQLRVRAQVA